jgi:hypothetical protein
LFNFNIVLVKGFQYSFQNPSALFILSLKDNFELDCSLKILVAFDFIQEKLSGSFFSNFSDKSKIVLLKIFIPVLSERNLVKSNPPKPHSENDLNSFNCSSCNK